MCTGPLGHRVGITVYGCESDEAELFDELSPHVGVVPTISREAVSEANAGWATGHRCVSVGHKSAVSGRVLRALSEAGVAHVSSRSVGVDHIDGEAATALGITVEGVAYDPDGVADFTLMLILMAIRNAKDVIRAAERHDFRLGPVRGRDLRDLTVGVVGAGRVGRAVIRRLQGFGCRVVACTRRPAAGLGGAVLVSLDELLRESDVVTLHLPLDTATHHFIGDDQFARMKPGAVLVNTGRGSLVDTDALLAALEAGRLGGAALDVLEGEEGIFYVDRTTRPVDHRALLRLLERPNVVVTPHTAFYTARSLHDTVERTLTSCLAFERNHGWTDPGSRSCSAAAPRSMTSR